MMGKVDSNLSENDEVPAVTARQERTQGRTTRSMNWQAGVGIEPQVSDSLGIHRAYSTQVMFPNSRFACSVYFTCARSRS